MGQTRAPSHVQRRFLQSSRSLFNPPAEAVGAKENSEENAPRSRTQSRSNGFGGSWGRSIPSQIQSSNNLGHSDPHSPIIDSSNQTRTSRPGYRGSLGDLLPHEKRARELLLLQQQKNGERPVNRSFGNGPQSTRAGRYEPTGWYERDERIKISKDSLARQKAMEANYRTPVHEDDSSKGDSRPAFRIRRMESNHIIDNQVKPQGTNPPRESARRFQVRPNAASTFQKSNTRDVLDTNPSIPSSQARPNGSSVPPTNLNTRRDIVETGEDLDAWERQRRDEAGSSSWGNLRRNSDRQPEENAFTRGRSDREERAKVASYSPLWSNSSNNETRYQRQPELREAAYVGRSYNPRHSNFASSEPTENQKRILSQAEEVTFQPMVKEEVIKITDADLYGVSREKSRKTRTQYEPVENVRGKGKDRDKARRRQHFATAEEADEEDQEALARAEVKRQRKLEKAAKKAAAPTPILLPEFISVSNLAVALKVKYEDFVYKLHELGYMETSRDHILNSENAGLIAGEYNFEPIIDRSESEDLKAREQAEDPSLLPPRPPVVTIMGHVDHGKTTLLDYLRKSSVAASEHGGITQHIGAFSVPMPGGKTITFLDTPGHAAFLSMRQRGAHVTDIVILVVAADDSVKPQTIEAINHAKAAKVPMIVAINKIDKGDTNIERVKQDLGRHGVELEDFGGDTQVVLVSGKTGQGMDELEEAAVTLSEILDMRAEKDGPAEGWVLEASIKSMGKVATVLVRRGTMRIGDFIVAGKTWARIRCLRNEAGIEIEEAPPGTPVEIDGWREQPLAGDEVLQAPDEAKAKSVVEYRLENEERDRMAEDMEAVNQSRKAEFEKRERDKLEAIAKKEAAEAGETDVTKKGDDASGPKQVYFIIKGDVSGSVEAVVDSLSILGNKEVQLNIIRSGVGQLSEFDVEHASAAKGYLINFNTTVEPNIAQLAEKAKVPIIDQNIIYRLVDEVKAELSKHLPPLVTQRVLGEAEVAQVFEITIKGRKKKNIAGCKIRNGTINRTERVRVMRDGEKVYDGTYFSKDFFRNCG